MTLGYAPEGDAAPRSWKDHTLSMHIVPPKRRLPAVLLAVVAVAVTAAIGLSVRAPALRRSAKHDPTVLSALDRLPPVPDKPVKNVIVMIGDGMGFNQVAAADLYRNGKRTGSVYAGFPIGLACSTFPAGGSYDPDKAWSDFAYVTKDPTDSAAAGTALATGRKTGLGKIGESVDGELLENAIEAADRIGKATGVVTSVPFAHATPGAFVAHDSSRRDIKDIAGKMLASTAIDVIIGTGHPWYDDGGKRVEKQGPRAYDYVGGADSWDKLVHGRLGGKTPFAFAETRAQVQALARGDTPERLVVVPQVYMTLQERRPGNRHGAPYVVPPTKTVPTLAEETKAALNVLDADPDGMMLMVEGGAIDWASHANEAGRVIEEQEQFDEAVGAVYAWVEANSDWTETMLIVTADHETGYLTGPGSGPGKAGGKPEWTPIAAAGELEMPAMTWHAKTHTNSLVPVWAHGAHARRLLEKMEGDDPVHGRYIDDTAIGRTIFRAMHVSKD